MAAHGRCHCNNFTTGRETEIIMNIWQELRFFLSRLNRNRAEMELDEEIRAHIEMEVAANIEAGMSEEAARAKARLAFGRVNGAKEDCRTIWGMRSVEIFWQD